MALDPTTGEPASAMPLERLAQLLDAYGGAPARWPEAERAAAERLLGESAAARTLHERALALDQLLDALPSEPPSRLLSDRVLAQMPRRRRPPPWLRLLLLAAPAAAAAALVLWLVTDRQPVHRTKVAALAVGQYASPTDVLLQSFAIDASAAVPAVGCADSRLGCPNGFDAPRRVRGRSDG